MPAAQKIYRATADTAQAVGEFKKAGAAGEEMAKRIRDGAKSVPPALKALDAAAAQAKGSMQGLAGQAGPIGGILSAIGPAGVAAAAGAGLLIGAFAGAKDAANSMRDLKRAAASIGGDVETLQEWRAVLASVGADAGGAERALQGFSEKLGELRSGVGLDAAKNLRALGFSDAEIANFTSVKDALPVITERLAELGSEAERTALAKKLGIGDLVPALNAGAGAMERARKEARELGLVYDEELIKRGAEAAVQFDKASAIIDAEFKTALLDLLPVMTKVAGGLADVAQSVGDIWDRFRDVDERSTSNLNERANKLAREIAQRKAALTGMSAGNEDYAARLIGSDDMLKQLRAEQGNIAETLISRSIHNPARSSSGRKTTSQAPSATSSAGPDPNAGLVSELETLRRLTAEREKLEGVERLFPGILESEAKERVALADVMASIDTARARGVIATDEEAESLRAMAQANFDASQSVRDREAAMKSAEEEQKRQIELDREAEQAARDREEAERARMEQFQTRFEQTRDLFGALKRGGQEAEDAILQLANDVIPKLIAKLFALKDAQTDAVSGDGGLADLLVNLGASLLGGTIQTPQSVNTGSGWVDPAVFRQADPVVSLYAGGRDSGGWVDEGQWVDVGERRAERLRVVGGRAFVSPNMSAPAREGAIVNVTVINQTSTPVEAEQRRDADGDMEIVLRSATRNGIGRGDFDGPLAARYGLKPRTS